MQAVGLSILLVFASCIAMDVRNGTTPDFCLDEPSPGMCSAYIESYFYNASAKECQTFIYGGCHGNRNSFETVDECLRVCSPTTLSNVE
ncbi:Kunitz/Bovine pancreatic trypsin inhibitor domain protein [Opisthorchis viverrini]|uniref:Kunitz/Bovine pancreatic trypsin inhibitor domain protein n=1 Tax=Opisthorchis viverrini TaxID=6198 RepID=A0A1S8WPH7_OPIVI|nr:Kunitz/Bovine pancreatic trypsin inhibitor domain protein [Opisthorchis viverrini]